MSEMAKLYNKERKKQREKLSESMGVLVVKIPIKMLKMIDTISNQDGHTRSAFVRYALASYVKRWKPSLNNKNAWPPCRHCGERHDSSMHGIDAY